MQSPLFPLALNLLHLVHHFSTHYIMHQNKTKTKQKHMCCLWKSPTIPTPTIINIQLNECFFKTKTKPAHYQLPNAEHEVELLYWIKCACRCISHQLTRDLSFTLHLTWNEKTCQNKKCIHTFSCLTFNLGLFQCESFDFAYGDNFLWGTFYSPTRCFNRSSRGAEQIHSVSYGATTKSWVTDSR